MSQTRSRDSNSFVYRPELLLNQSSQPISIIIPLMDTTCEEGDQIILACKVHSLAPFTARWYCDNAECPDNNHFLKSVDNDGYVRLKIPRASDEDSGQYMVAIASNKLEVSSQCRVRVQSQGLDKRRMRSNLSTQQFSQPLLIKELQNIQARTGETCRLKCRVYGHPIPKVKWFRSGSPLYPSTRVNMQFDFNGFASLIIRNVEPNDAGQYIAVFENSVGTVTSAAVLDVLSLSSNQYQPTSGGPPVIVNPPKSITVAEGQTVLLECELSSAQKAKVNWLHNNGQLMTSGRYKAYFDGRRASLRIFNVSDIDKGIYTIIADNSHGSTSFSVSIDIVENSSQTQYPSYDIPPELITGYEHRPAVVNANLKSDNTGEIDDSSMFDQSVFKHLDRSTAKTDDDDIEAGIDTTPLRSSSKIAELEAARLKKLEKQFEAGVDEATIRNLSNIAELERRNSEKYQRQNDLTENVVDTNTKRDLSLFHNLEAEEKRKNFTGPPVDSTPIVDPKAFFYLERVAAKTAEVTAGVDDTPIVDPSAFRYVEPRVSEKKSRGTSLIDSRPIIAPKAFAHLNRPPTPKMELLESTVDTDPIICLDALKYIERPERPKKRSNSPSVDSSPYVNLSAFRYLEIKDPRKEDIEPGVDETAYIPMDAFRYVEIEPQEKTDYLGGPAVDTTPMISPDAFAELETKPVQKGNYEGPDIDDTAYIDPSILRNLEAPKISVVEQIDDDQGFEPKIEGSLGEVNVFEGQRAIFEVHVIAVPYPEISWSRNGSPVHPSSRIISKYNIAKRVASLEISNCIIDDSGSYELCALNKKGSVSSYGRLVVHDMGKIDETGFVPLERFRSIEINQ